MTNITVTIGSRGEARPSPPPAPKPRRRRRGEQIEFRVDPEWEKTQDARDFLRKYLAESIYLTESFEDYLPADSGKALPSDGGWIMVTNPPERLPYAVPPFSIWFATPWPMTKGGIGDSVSERVIRPKRVKIITPIGEIGLFPTEYDLVGDIAGYVGRDAEGMHVRELSGRPAVNADSLHYIMSRGIRLKDALLILLPSIRDTAFVWFEMSPQYGEYFGKPWPTRVRCPFCTPRKRWPAIDLQRALPELCHKQG